MFFSSVWRLIWGESLLSDFWTCGLMLFLPMWFCFVLFNSLRSLDWTPVLFSSSAALCVLKSLLDLGQRWPPPSPWAPAAGRPEEGGEQATPQKPPGTETDCGGARVYAISLRALLSAMGALTLASAATPRAFWPSTPGAWGVQPRPAAPDAPLPRRQVGILYVAERAGLGWPSGPAAECRLPGPRWCLPEPGPAWHAVRAHPVNLHPAQTRGRRPSASAWAPGASWPGASPVGVNIKSISEKKITVQHLSPFKYISTHDCS